MTGGVLIRHAGTVHNSSANVWVEFYSQCMTTTVSVSLYEMTFGDLYDFVDLARRAGVPREEAVSQEWDGGEDAEGGPDRLAVQLENLGVVQSPDFSGIDRKHYVEVLDAVISSDGDARYATEEIKEIRDRLVAASD